MACSAASPGRIGFKIPQDEGEALFTADAPQGSVEGDPLFLFGSPVGQIDEETFRPAVADGPQGVDALQPEGGNLHQLDQVGDGEGIPQLAQGLGGGLHPHRIGLTFVQGGQDQGGDQEVLILVGQILDDGVSLFDHGEQLIPGLFEGPLVPGLLVLVGVDHGADEAVHPLLRLLPGRRGQVEAVDAEGDLLFYYVRHGPLVVQADEFGDGAAGAFQGALDPFQLVDEEEGIVFGDEVHHLLDLDNPVLDPGFRDQFVHVLQPVHSAVVVQVDVVLGQGGEDLLQGVAEVVAHDVGGEGKSRDGKEAESEDFLIHSAIVKDGSWGVN